MSNEVGPGQRDSMAKMEPIHMNDTPNGKDGSVFTQDLTGGFEPKYRNDDLSSKKVKKKSQDEDPWAIKEMESTTVPWNTLTREEKLKRVVTGIAKLIAVMTLLYFFVCSLDCLSLGFRLIGGRTTGEIFKNSEFLKNPVVGMMIGILTTVMVQSSSTSTSIIVSMVAADFLEVEQAIPIVMGANIGTSITNTIVSLTQAGDRAQFRRAFAGATVHDMFNWLTVITLLIIEVTTDYLYKLTTWIMDGITPSSESGEIKVLSVITEPFVKKIVELNKEVLDCWSLPNCTLHDKSTLLKVYCEVDPELEKCPNLFAMLEWSDVLTGAILLLCSLLVLCGCLILIVKVLQSVMQGQIANVIRKTLNAKVPYVPWITGYLAIGVGALMTFLVQSSSVFTSALTPLVGLGVISVERVYPLTLGSNIGTTTTALLAALSVEGDKFRPSLQIALCHLFFNISGILLFYPIPFMRFPIGMAKYLGETTAKYRWFAIAYMILMFVVLPGITMGLSIAGAVYVMVFAAILLFIFAVVFLLTFIQRKKPNWLPPVLRSWKFLPLPLRSLEPYDRIFTSWSCCKKLKNKSTDEDDGEDNAGFESERGSSNNVSMITVENPKNGKINPTFTTD